MDFLLTRGLDLVVLGVRLHDFAPAASGPVRPPAMVAGSDASRIVLWFPPQHLVEQTFGAVAVPGMPLQAMLSAASRVAFSVAGGTVVPLDAAGVLGACVQVAAPPSPAAPPGPIDTAIELPARLAFAPSATPGVTARHASIEFFGPMGAVGVWLTRLRPGGGGSRRGAGSLELHLLDPLGAAQLDDPGFPVALDLRARQTIAAAAATKPPTASRLELASLGGSLTALGDWDGARWSHRTTLGRDQEVVVEERGLLYPLGLRAVLTTVAVRDPSGEVATAGFQTPDAGAEPPPAAGPVPPGGPLGLRKMIRLQLIDTVKQTPPQQRRTFPFDEIEVTSARFSGLGPLEPGSVFFRPTPALAELRERLAARLEEAGVEELVWRTVTDGRTRVFDDLLRAGFGPALAVAAAQATLDSNAADLTALREADAANKLALEALQRAQRALDELLSSTPTPEDGSLPTGAAEAQQAVDDAFLALQDHPFSQTQAENLARLTALEGGALAAITAAQPECDLEMAQPRTVSDAALDTDVAGPAAAASTWIGLQQLIAQDRALVDAAQAKAQPFLVFGWPTTADGRRLAFPLRLRHGDSQLDVTMPLIFVKDFALDGTDVAPPYASLDDPELGPALDAAWRGSDLDASAAAAPAGHVDVPGVLLDVVGAEQPKASDVNVVQALHVLGAAPTTVSGLDLFVPTLGRAAGADSPAIWAMAVDLPAVRSLLGPDAPPLGTRLGATDIPVAFATDFLSNGADASRLFDTVDAVAIDFTQRADRSGGLAGMQLDATAISRELGPVQVPVSTDPKELIGAGATLLGFRLRDLVAAVAAAPRIVTTEIDGGTPVVEMVWANVELEDVLSFQAHRGEDASRRSRMDLTVRSSPEQVTTTCTVTDFTLVFPPSAAEPLISLDFSSLEYHQVTQLGNTEAPTVKISEPEIRFGGALQLLETLQQLANMIGDAPGMLASPRGVTATLELPLPDAACGAFSLTNIVFRTVIDVPFQGDPVSVRIAFASRERPFGVSVLTFGGTGYVDIRIDADGPAIDASMDFGARMAVNFLVARGEVHALGGLRYVQHGPTVKLTGFIRIGGSVSVLELVSASIELVIELGYDTDSKTLAGRATLVLEIDLTLWSASVEIDSGLWVIAGGGPDADGTGRISSADRASLATEPDAAGAGGGATADIASLAGDPDAAFALVDAPVTDDELAAWRAYRRRFSRGAADE